MPHRLPVSALARDMGRALVCGALAALPWVALAGPENITDGELALLPDYCQDVQAIRYGNAVDNPSPRAGHWTGLMGKNFWHMHHYCWGLIHVRRSQQPGVPPTQRLGMLNAAIADYLYVIQNTPRDFALAPEILLRIGEAELLRNQPVGARAAFERARALKPDYWPAYVRWIDYLVKSKQVAEAKLLAAEGLSHAPGSQELANVYRRLGGDPSTVARAPTREVLPPADAATQPSVAASASDGGSANEPSSTASAPPDPTKVPAPAPVN